MATFPLITANDDQFPAVWHTGPVDTDGNIQPITSSSFDSLFLQTILIWQRGVLIDTSQYEHTLSVQTGGVTTLVAVPEFPGGLGVQITGVHNGSGILITPSISGATVFNAANKSRCWQFFIKNIDMTLGSQIAYNDGFAFNGNTVYNTITTGKLATRINSGGEIPSPVGVPVIVSGIAYFCQLQFYASDHPITPNKIKFWVGAVADGIADGVASVSNVTRPVDAVTAGPYIGYVGGSGGTNNSIYGPYRITDGVRTELSVDAIDIPTTLWPEA
jgi:hypothetical protein